MSDGRRPDPDTPSGAGRRLIAAVRRFLAVEAASGVVLVAATVIALVWVNVGSESSYRSLWEAHPDIGWAGRLGHLDLHGFVNDGLMTIFFFVVGLEIKYEWVRGALQDRRFARLPIIAALGGMIVPALLYVAFAAGTPAGHGWGIPMATDIAFVVGVMALLGSRVPAPVKVFLLTLAIVDDLGAIVVIAVFYAGDLQWGWLGLTALGLAVTTAMRSLAVQRIWLYVLIGVPVWFATWQSGVHATIAGVALAFITPMNVRVGDRVWSPIERLLEWLHPWSSFVVIPLFALANAGVVLAGDTGPDGGRVAAGIVVGLVVGKCVGVAGASLVTVRAGVATLPDQVRRSHLVGAGLLAGIGFTMSLFITDLAFSGFEAAELTDTAKRAVLSASLIAAIAGSVVFLLLHRRSDRPDRPERPEPAAP